MFVRIKSTPHSPRRSVQIVESRRVGTKVSQSIVRHVGVAMDDAEERELVRLADVIRAKMEAERSESLPLFAPEEVAAGASLRKRGPKPGHTRREADAVRLRDVVEEQRVIEGISEVFGTLFDQLGFGQIVPVPHSEVLKATVLARLANPVSKHRTAALLEQDWGVRIPLDRIYRMMDALHARQAEAQQRVRQATTQLWPGKIDLVFFDVTTLYFESIEQDALRDFGYSKDQKFHSVQVVLALATTEHGLPVGYKLFQGATAEVKTLLQCVDAWRNEVEIGSVVLVADRAMMSETNLSALEQRGIEYIVGASLRKQPASLRAQILEQTGYRLAHLDSDCVWVNEYPVGEHRRLITAYSAQRARKDAADRQQIVDKLTKKLGEAKKGALKKLVSNRGYLKFASTEGQASAVLDADKIERDAMWDGMYGVITNAKDLDKLAALARYRRLWTIEQAFRISKHDLAMRPIFHFKPERIEAHVALCFLAYALLRHAQYRIRLQQHPMSVEQIRNELLRVQASIVRDTRYGGLHRLPSRMTEEAKAIYRVFGLDRSIVPTRLN